MSTEFSFAGEEGNAEEWKNTAVEIINGLIAGLSVLVGAMTFFVTLFLESGWINGSFFGLNDVFKDIWILVSNIVYFVFAGIIIWIAFMNILGKGEKWELKQALPKFIIGVLIVPFSWFFVQFVLSLSAILTVSSLSLPYDTFEKHAKIFDKVSIPKSCVIDLGFSADVPTNSWDVNARDNRRSGKFFECTGEQTLGGSLKNSSFGLISIYTYGILNLEDLEKLLKEEFTANKIKNIGDLIIKVVFNLLFVVVYMLLIITLGIVLAVRGIYLWIFIMISPVFGLMYFFDKNEGGGEGVLSKFNIKEFISLALIPVYVTLALSFGLLFITTISTGINSPTNTGDVKIEKDVMTIGEVTLEIRGPVGGGSDDALKPINIIATGGEGVLGTIGTLILYFMGVAVLRISIMAAMRTSDITKAITEPVYNFGNQVGSLIAKSPQYAPIMPGLPSMKGIEKIGSMPISALETRTGNRVGGYQEGINKVFGANSVDIAKKIRIENMLRDGKIDSDKELLTLQNEIKDLINKHGTDNQVVRDLMTRFASVAQNTPGIKMLDGEESMDKLFAGGKLSNTGYGLLHIKTRTADVNAYNSGVVDSYVTSHKIAGGGESEDGEEKGTKGVGDNHYGSTTNEEFKKFEADKEIGDKIKVKLTKGKTHGSGIILNMFEDGDGGEEINVRFQRTSKTAPEMIGDDLKELIELSGKIPKDDDLIKVLEGLKFENPDKIVEELNNVKNKE